MKWRSLRYDKDVKPFWKKGMKISWDIVMLLIIIKVFVSMWAQYNKEGREVVDAMTWVILVLVAILIIPGIVYLIKPELFKVEKLNKESIVQVCDATGDE